MKCYLFSFILLWFFAVLANAADYQINDIQVVGLQRVSSGTVFSAIDITANSVISDKDIQQAIRDLFATEFFDDVQVGRKDDLLIFEVKERPVIASIITEGNKVLDKDALMEALKALGLAEGEIFKSSVLDLISKQLNAQYSALGRYSAKIETLSKITDLNQVIIGIRIDEGHVAKIKHINVVGNTTFKEETLRDLFSLNTTGTWSWLTGSDRYAKEKLAGDLEDLRSFYLDNGYLEFDILSTQVSLSPDKSTVFITVNVSEGSQYIVSDIAFAGDLVLPEAELRGLMPISPGQIYSQLSVQQGEKAVERRFADQGYSSARVSAEPKLDSDLANVALTFYVRPGQISYVRRITFTGNTATEDHVLRREMRQIEGAPVSADKLEQSKTRLLRLGLFGDVKMSTKEVPGSIDQLDVEVTVIEQPSASINLSLGYSGGNGLTLGAGLQHNNWLGSGNTFGFNIETSETESNYTLNFRNPYYTKDGVSRGISLFYQERDYEDVEISNYATDSTGLRVTFGYPISETGRISLGLGFENIEVTPGVTSAQEIIGSPRLRNTVDNAFITNSHYQSTILPALGGFEDADTNNNGVLDENDSAVGGSDLPALVTSSNPIDGEYDTLAANPNAVREGNEGFLDKYGDEFDTFSLDFGWSNSSLNRGVFPTKGSSQRLQLEVAVPGGDLEFYKFTYRSDFYVPLADRSTLRLRSRFGYAEAYGELDELPFFENYFSGGIGSVRGFEPRSLGPKATPASAYFAVPVNLDNAAGSVSALNDVYVLDTDNQLLVGADDDVDTLGGNILVELSLELVFPVPFVKSSNKVRSQLFVDAGNVFSNNCGELQRNCDNVDFSKLSVAAGFGIQWLSPIGPIVFSYATPIEEQPFDQPEEFQFSLGRSF